MTRQLIFLLTFLWTLLAGAQDADTVKHRMDSLLRQEKQLRMQVMLLQDELDRQGATAREDSLRRVSQKQRIDSLRKITPGVPMVIDGDTLLYIYASLGGEDAEHRVETATRKVTQIGKSLQLTTDSMYIFDGEYTADIMCGEIVLLRVSDLDGLWNGMSRQELAEQQLKVLSTTIEELHSDYGLEAKLTGLAWAVFLIVVQVLFFLLTARLTRYLRRKVISGVSGRVHPLMFNNYVVLNMHQVKRILLWLIRCLQLLLIVLQLFISLPLLFSIFPETEKFTWNMISYIWSPLRDIAVRMVTYFPNLVKIIVILIVVRWLLKVMRHITNEIGSGRLQIDRFYQDWALPTYHIVRIFVVAFTIVVIWPLLPGSESGVFKGVSIFVAALFSLGSTSSIGNLVSGIIITYMRPFLEGDYVRIGDREGVVVEKNTFVTRLRDIKGNYVTVPNNSILSQQTVNYTAAVRQGQGSIVHTEFTFTYKVPRATIEAYMLEAADRCQLLLKDPKPFVLVTGLEDFYTRYEVNAYTAETEQLFEVYSELHKHIIDVFREHDLDPTSSHFLKVAHIES